MLKILVKDSKSIYVWISLWIWLSLLLDLVFDVESVVLDNWKPNNVIVYPLSPVILPSLSDKLKRKFLFFKVVVLSSIEPYFEYK